MKILSVHNTYQQPGGEDEVFRQEAQLLEQRGHEVIRFQAHNDEVKGMNAVQLLAKTIFNGQVYQRVRNLIQTARPDVMHVHNTFPLLSPSVYYAAVREKVPVVQTVHNYRLFCVAGTLFRGNGVCEQCLSTLTPWPAVAHGCYRQSRPASAAAAAMLTTHKILKTYRKAVSTYIVLSDFAYQKCIQGGIPEDRIAMKPNFIEPDPGRGDGSGGYCLFVGRLSKEKGIRTLLDAWIRFSPPLDLEIAGDGDLAAEVAEAVEQCPRIRWHGRLQKPQLADRMKRAAALIVPSIWYEPFGMVLIEAFAMGVPVIASRIGAMESMVASGSTGVHFTPGDAADLADKVQWAHDHPDALRDMRENARHEFESRYTGERSYSLLMQIYRDTIDGYGKLPEKHSAADVRNGINLVKISGQTASQPKISIEESDRISPLR